MKIIIRREDLTTVEMKAIEDRYAPYHRFAEFWTGFDTYQGDTGRYRCPWARVSVAGQAWNQGHDAAMHVRWERKLPARDEYESDDRDTAKMCRGLRAGIERMRKNGTLPARRELRPYRHDLNLPLNLRSELRSYFHCIMKWVYMFVGEWPESSVPGR
jgi:hypothetical protein